MQAMARAQAEGGGAPGSPGKAPSRYPFDVLRIWRSKVAAEGALDGAPAADQSSLAARHRSPLADQPLACRTRLPPQAQMQDDLHAADAKGPSQRYRLRLLVQQGKDVEQAGKSGRDAAPAAAAAASAACRLTLLPPLLILLHPSWQCWAA